MRVERRAHAQLPLAPERAEGGAAVEAVEVVGCFGEFGGGEVGVVLYVARIHLESCEG